MSYHNGGYETQKQGSEIGGTPVTPPFFWGFVVYNFCKRMSNQQQGTVCQDEMGNQKIRKN